jgi:tetratricopeptide (TPR) repeat protein
MKRKYTQFFLFHVILLIMFGSSNCIILNQDVQKAKEFMEVGMYPNALELLNKRIKEDPSDAEAHLLLGECYLNQGDYGKAKDQFDNALKLNSNLSNKIGGVYKRAGDKANNAYQMAAALNLYQEAIIYRPDLKELILQAIYEQGMQDFDRGEYESADHRFFLATSLDPTLKKEFSDLYFNLGKNADEELGRDLFRRTKKYSNHHDHEIGEILLRIAYTKNSEVEIQKWRKEASLYIEVPPDYKECIIGSNPFNLKKGELSKFWFRIPQGKKLVVSIYAYKNTYEVLNRDLEGNINIYRIWKGEKLPSNLFPDIKIKALENTLGEIIIKKKFIDD